MRRKTIFWIVVAVLAAAVLAAVGIVAYHVGINHGAARSVTVSPLRRFGFATPRVVVGGAAGFSAASSLLLLLIGGAVGAAIGYLAWGGRAGATAAQPAVVATAVQPPVPPAGGPVNPLWQQFDEWHRSVHAAPSPPVSETPTMAAAAAPPVATSTSPGSAVTQESPGSTASPEPPRPAGTSDPPEPPATPSGTT